MIHVLFVGGRRYFGDPTKKEQLFLFVMGVISLILLLFALTDPFS